MKFDPLLKSKLYQRLRDDANSFNQFIEISSQYLVLICSDGFSLSDSLAKFLGYSNLEGVRLNDIFPNYLIFKDHDGQSEMNRVQIKAENGSYLSFAFRQIEMNCEAKGDLSIFSLEKLSKAELNKTIKEEISRVAKIGTWEVDFLNKKLQWDSIVKEIHGVDDDYEPELNRAIEYYKEGYSRDLLNVLLQALVENQKEFDAELQIITAQNKEIWVRVIGKGVFENHECVKIFGIIQNIDQQRRWSDEIKERDTRFSLAVEASQLGIWDLDPISGKLIWDDQMFRLYDVKPHKFGGTIDDWESAVHLDDRARSKEEIAIAIRDKTKIDLEFRVVHSNGDLRNIRALAKTIWNDRGVCTRIIGTNWDVTEFNRASYEKKSALEKLEGILNATTNVSIISTNTEGIITSFNKGAENLLGYNPHEVIGVHSPMLFHSEKEVAQRSSDLSKEHNKIIDGFETFVFNAKEDKADINEWSYFHKSGIAKSVQLIVTVIRNEQKEITGYLGVAVDISDLKKTQSEMSSLLAISGNQNRRLKNFAYIVSHNLRSYSTNFSMLLSIAKSDDVDLENEVLPMLNAASKNLDQAISHLNEVATINIEDKPLKAICLNSCIKQVIDESRLEFKNIKINYSINTDEVFTVLGVKEYVMSTLRNIINNAIRFRSIKRELTIQLRISSTKHKVQIEIEDNGMGINLEKNNSKIFGLYKTFHEVEGSRGAGLFIVKNQVEAMQGTISIKSKVDVGTTIKVELNEQV